MALNEVESAGDGFIAGTGQPKILYERHIMYRRLRDAGLDAKAAAREHPGLVNTRPGGYAGGAAEHERLRRATAIDNTSAYESASWGAFQVMGYHWEHLGYSSVQALVDDARESEAAQLGMLVRFIEADSRLHAALRRHDWPRVAAIYNGPAYAKNDYDHKLAAAHRRYSTMPQHKEVA